MSSKPTFSSGLNAVYHPVGFLVLGLAIRQDDRLGVVDVAARREEAPGQPDSSARIRSLGLGSSRTPPSDLAKILDDALIPVVDERLRVDIDRPVPGEEQFLFPGLDHSRNSRADHKEQVSFSGSDERSIPIDEMNLSVVANENIRRMDVRVAENVIERSGLKPPSQPFRPSDNLVYPRGAPARRQRTPRRPRSRTPWFRSDPGCAGPMRLRERKGLDGKPAAELLRQPTGMNGLQRRPELTPLVIAHPGVHRVLAGDKWVENQAAPSQEHQSRLIAFAAAQARCEFRAPTMPRGRSARTRRPART